MNAAECVSLARSLIANNLRLIASSVIASAERACRIEEQMAVGLPFADAKQSKCILGLQTPEELIEVDIADYVDIVQKYGLCFGKILFGIQKTASRVKQFLLFIGEVDVGRIAFAFDVFVYLFGKVVCVDNYMLYAEVYHLPYIPLEKTATCHFHKGFGSVFGQRHEACSHAGGEYHCFHVYFLLTGYSILTW